MSPPKVSALLTAGVPRFSHEGSVESIAFSPDGSRVVACDLRWTTVWDPETSRVMWRAAPGGVAEFIDDEALIVSGYNNQPAIFNAGTGEMLAAPPFFCSHAILIPEEDGEGEAAFAFHAVLEGEPSAGVIVLSLPGAPLAEEGKAGDREKQGFGAMVTAWMAASPDGKTLVIAERARAKTSLRAVGARSLAKIWSSDLAVEKMAFMPDRTCIAALLQDGALAFLDLATGREIGRAPGERIGAFAFTVEGARLAIASGREIRILDAKSLATQETLEPAGLAKDVTIGALAFSPDGKRLAVGLPERMTMFELGSGRELGATAGHARGVWAIAAPGSGVVVTRGALETKSWLVASGELSRIDTRTEEIWPIPALAAAPGGGFLDAEFGAIRVKNARGDIAASLESPSGQAGAAAQLLVAHDAKRVAAVYGPEGENARTATVRILDLGTGAEIASPTKLPGELRADSPLAYSPDGARLALLVRNDENYTDRAVVIDAATGRVEAESEGGQSIVALAFLDRARLLIVTPGGMTVLTVGGTTETVTIQDATPREFGDNEDDDSDDGTSATAVAVSPDGTLVAFANAYAGTVRVCESGKWNEAVLCGTRLGVKLVTFSADSKTLAAGLEDGSLRVWSVGA